MNLIPILKKFNQFLDRKQKKNLIILFFITLIGAGFEVLGVSMMLPLFTAIIDPDIIHENALAARVCAIFKLNNHQTFVIVCIIALIIIFIVKNLFLFFSSYVQMRFIFNNRFQTQKQLLHAFLCRPYEYYLNSSSGKILRMINGDVDQTYGLLSTLLAFFTESIISVALLTTIFIIDPMMSSIIAILLAIVIVVITKVIRPILSRLGNECRKQSQESYKWLIQSIEGIKEIKIAHNEPYFEKNYTDCGYRLIHAGAIESVINTAPRMLIEVGCVCSALSVIALMIYSGRDVASLVPALSAFAMAALKLMPAANRIISMAGTIAYRGPAVDNLMENLNAANLDTSHYLENQHSLQFEKSIELKNITYKYPNSSSYVINNASMLIPIGMSVGIVGRSGAGKTTSVDIMLGLLTPESGQILVDGKDIMSDYACWLSHIGYIPQSMFMVDDTIRANIAFGCEPEDEKVWAALREAQLEDFVRSLPDGIYTTIGERGVRLSGGQRQRISIARALYHNPEILVFDEATSSLDNETEAAIMESINSLHGKKTMIIIAHRLQTIEKCDLVYRVEEEGISISRGELPK